MEIARRRVAIGIGPQGLLQDFAVDRRSGVGTQPTQQRSSAGLHVCHHHGLPIDQDPKISEATDREWTWRRGFGLPEMDLEDVWAKPGSCVGGNCKLDELRSVLLSRLCQSEIDKNLGAFHR